MALQTITYTIGDFAWHSWSNGYKLDLILTEQSVDIGTNTSLVDYRLQLRSGSNNRFTSTLRCSVELAGVEVATGDVGCDAAYNYTYILLEGSCQVGHNADGTLNMTAVGRIEDIRGNSYAPPVLTISESWALTAIPRQATITQVQDFYDTDNPTIRYSNPAGEAVSSLQAGISIDLQELVPYREISKTAGTYQFFLTEAEREALRRAATGNPPEAMAQFHLKTGDIGSYSSPATFRVRESAATKPTVDGISVTAVNTGLPAAFDGLFIQRKSRAAIEVSASGKSGAWITGGSILAGGVTYSSLAAQTGVLAQAGDNGISATVTDSRGFTASGSGNIPVISYAPPSVKNAPGQSQILCFRGDGNGPDSASRHIFIQAARQYSPVISGGEQKNFCGLYYRVKIASDTWEGKPWTALIPRETAGTDVFSGVIPGEYDTNQAFSVELLAEDDLAERRSVSFDISTKEVDLHLGGKCVGIGRYADRTRPKSLSLAPDWDFYMGDTELRQLILNISHPVGSYMQTDSGDPGLSVGGSWAQQSENLWKRTQ